MKTPTSDLVAAAWLNALPDLLAPAATSRPADTSTWSATGFLVVSVVGSAGMRDLSGQRKPIVSVDAWAVSPGSSKPPVGMSAWLLEIVREATELPGPWTVTPTSGSVSYAPALITDVWLETAEARRVPDPDATYAHHTIDLGLSWVRAE